MPSAVLGAIALAYARRGEGPPVLLLHDGGSTGARGCAALFASLADDHDVLAPDLRGHGASTRVGGAVRLAWPGLVRDVAELVDALRLRGLGVVGIGDGATLALQLALAAPDRVRSLVLAGARSHVADEDVLRLDALRPENIRHGAAPLARELEDLHGPAYWELLMDRWVASFRIDRAFLDARPRLGQIGCRTLVAHGLRDPLTPVSHAHVIAAGIPHAQLVLVDHGRDLGRATEFADVVRDFFSADPA